MIPKIIHYIWLGGQPLPELANKCIESWKKYCPNYEIKLWDESNLNIDICPYVREAYDAKKYAFASDVLRYQVLFEHGGIYLDVDVELIRPIEDLLDNKLFMGFEDKNLVNPGLIMGAEIKNKHLEKLILEYEKEKFILDNGEMNLKTICERITRYLKNFGLVGDTGNIQNLAEIKIYPIEYFCPYNYETKKMKQTQNTYSIHWYNGSWVPELTFLQKIKIKIKNFIKLIIGKENAKKLKLKFSKKEKDEN